MAGAGGIGNVTLEISHLLSLAPTSMGSCYFEVLRASPSERLDFAEKGEGAVTPLSVADPVPGSVSHQQPALTCGSTTHWVARAKQRR